MCIHIAQRELKTFNIIILFKYIGTFQQNGDGEKTKIYYTCFKTKNKKKSKGRHKSQKANQKDVLVGSVCAY